MLHFSIPFLFTVFNMWSFFFFFFVLWVGLTPRCVLCHLVARL